MGLRKEFLAFAFGILIILVTFGDNHLGKIGGVPIGNLDTIFGHNLWPVLDVVYPLASILVFLLYGWSFSAKAKIKSGSTVLFVSYVVVLALMNADDIQIGLSHIGLNLSLTPPQEYWVAISWIYPVYATVTFFLFGVIVKNK